MGIHKIQGICLMLLIAKRTPKKLLRKIDGEVLIIFVQAARLKSDSLYSAS